MNALMEKNNYKEKSIRISRVDSYITRMRDRNKIEERIEKNRIENNFFCKLVKYVK